MYVVWAIYAYLYVLHIIMLMCSNNNSWRTIPGGTYYWVTCRECCVKRRYLRGVPTLYYSRRNAVVVDHRLVTYYYYVNYM